VSLSKLDALRIGDLDAHDQAGLVARGELSARELAEAALIRIAAVNGDVNAVTHVADIDSLAFAAGEGALAGVPYLLKASLEYPGWPVTSCSRSRATATGRTAWPFVRSLDSAGLIPVGMTAMPEFGLLTGGEPMLTGAVRNPWSPGHSAGGSSTGAAAAVAAGLVPLAHASDAAGSIRVPAASCGVIGLKASRGANLRARAPHVIDDLLCSDGLIGRSVRDVAWAHARTSSPDLPLADARPIAGLRVAVCLTGLDSRASTAEVREATLAAARLCADLGAHVEDAVLTVDGAAVIQAFKTIWLHEGGEIADLIGAANPATSLDELLEPWTIGLSERRQALPLGATGAAFAQVALSAAALAGLFERYDVVLSPVTSTPPPPLGVFDPAGDFDALWTAFWDYTNYTPLQNIAGTPAITLPLGMSADGRPIGAMFAAAAGHDRRLLALAAALEEAAPWRDRWPTLSAHAAAEALAG
jgi:amidase